MIEAVPDEVLREVVRATFGDRARVERAERIGPAWRHGLPRRAGSTRNLLYRVWLEGEPGSFVFRFHRGPGDDRYEEERRSYRLLAEATGVRVPTVLAVDRERLAAPVPYMVMDYLEGEAWEFLAHPDNPETTPGEKERVLERVGDFFARVHGVTRPAREGEGELGVVLHLLDRLEGGVRRGNLRLDPGEIDRCRAAARAEPHFRGGTLSLCLADTELYFTRSGGEWEVAFACDAEWMAYRDPYGDLATMLGSPTPLWGLDHPLEVDPAATARLPFFRGYAARRPVDHAKLARVALFHQLGAWGYLANEPCSPEKREWLRWREPLVRELVERICAPSRAAAAR